MRHLRYNGALRRKPHPVLTRFSPGSHPVLTRFQTQFQPNSNPIPTQFQPNSNPIPTRASRGVSWIVRANEETRPRSEIRGSASGPCRTKIEFDIPMCERNIPMYLAPSFCIRHPLWHSGQKRKPGKSPTGRMERIGLHRADGSKFVDLRRLLGFWALSRTVRRTRCRVVQAGTQGADGDISGSSSFALGGDPR